MTPSNPSAPVVVGVPAEVSPSASAVPWARRPIPTLYRLPWLLLAFAPWYLKHLFLAPYRPLPWWSRIRGLFTDLRRRHRIALYDGVLNIILNGLSALAGRAVGVVAGRIAVAFTRLAFSFDDEYERRCARGEPVTFDDVFGGAQVAEALGEWRAVMQPFPTYPAVRSHLHEFVRSLYADYTIGGRPTTTDIDFAQLLRAATLDSGGFLTAVAQVVALSLNVTLPEPAYRQFSALGVLGKAADDMIDFRADLLAQRPNLLAVLARENPSEFEPVPLAAASDARMNTVWWRRHCPVAWSRYLAECSALYATLGTRWLRFASHLLWVPALLGRSTTRDVRGRL